MEPDRWNMEDHLLLRYLQGDADDALRRAVEAWLAADTGNREHLDRLEALWLETGKISPVPVAVDTDRAWQRMAGRMREEKSPATVSIRRYWYLWAAAAMVLLLAGIFTLFRLTGTVAEKQMIAAGRVLTDTLPDNTRVKLNRQSVLTCPAKFGDRFREVRLQGEAFFEVVHDASHPFIVDAAMAKIRVVGTSFRVKAAGDSVRVDVVTGRVMLFRVDSRTGDTLSLLLGEGESGVMKKRTMKPEKAGDARPDDLFWARHSLDFRDTPLSQVFALLGKYYGVKIVTDDPSVLDCRLTASFAGEPAARILEVIAGSFGLKLESERDPYHFSGHGCSKENR